MQSRSEGCGLRAGEGLALLALGAALLGVPARAAHGFGSAPVPDWVKIAAQEKLPEFHHPKAVVPLEDATYAVDAKGQAVEYVRRVAKILRPAGVQISGVSYDYDSRCFLCTSGVLTRRDINT